MLAKIAFVAALAAAAAAAASAQVSPWEEAAYLKASNLETNDSFGNAVSVSGPRMAVGAGRERSCNASAPFDNSCLSAGAVYIFDLDPVSGNWTQTAFLKPDTAGISANFGFSVSLDGDRVAVGAPYMGPNRVGAAYIFDFDHSTGWAQTAELRASNPQRNAYFGYSVSLDADRVAVGASGDASCGTGTNTGNGTATGCANSGAVYLFERGAASGNWSQTVFAKANNTGASDSFGRVVSLDGERVAIGSSGEASCSASNQSDNGCREAGAVWIMERASGTGLWSYTAYLKASNIDAGDAFGDALSLDGDMLAVGAAVEASCSVWGGPLNQTNNDCEYSGAVYIFEFAASSWTQTAYIKAINTNLDDSFGLSVALDANRLVVGGSYESSCNSSNPASNACTESGAAYVYERDPASGDWSFVAFLKASNADAYDYFAGFAAGISLDGPYLAVGAEAEDSCTANNQTNNDCDAAGAVYVFNAAAVTTGTTATTATTAAAITTGSLTSTGGNSTTGGTNGTSTTGAPGTSVAPPPPSPAAPVVISPATPGTRPLWSATLAAVGVVSLLLLLALPQ